MKIDLSLDDLSTELVNIITFLIGVLASTAGVLIGNTNSDLEVILVSIGASMIASSLIVFLSSRYLVRQSQIKKIIDSWGLQAIYNTRSEMNRSADKTFEKLHNELDLIGFGFRAFRSAKGLEIEEKVKRGLKVRILSINPNSTFVAQREKDENEVPGQIKKTILDLQKWVEKLKLLSPKSDFIQIKFYDNLPLESYYRQDGYIYTGPYLYGKPSQQTISYEYKCNSLGYNYWNTYFNTLWEDSEFAE